ncbi:site-specific integrase [Rhizobium sp. IBUN]|uniref:tyrosine-type recombinase/integrase n=1 Tax=Rhizobium sp. IBUN TaxID=1042326 RepID=UPI0018DB50CB|nr:site-specific integrase [Rhizobium sp. IBUN]
MREIPGTTAFEEEVACARLGVAYLPKDRTHVAPTLEEARQAKAGSLLWLVREYKRRAKNLLAPDQLARRARLLEEICESMHGSVKRGDLPFAAMEKRHVIEIRDEIKSTPGAQNNLIKTLSAMFGWAMEVGIAEKNPALRIKKLYSGDGFHTWTVEEVRQFETRHPSGTKANLFMHLALFTGLRLQELAILGRQHVQNGQLVIRPGKTRKSSGAIIDIPVLTILQDHLDQLPATQMTFMCTEGGKPFSTNGLGNKMRDWCDQAGLAHCSTHGLRKAGATIAAENGATDDELMAIYGWTTKKQTTLYTKQADRKKLAAAAIHKLIPAQK